MITLTEKAATKAKALLEKSGKSGAAIRVRIVSGGCSGFEYKIEPDTDGQKPNDQVAESFGLKIYMDPKTILYIAGSELDYVSSLTNAGFKIKNPHAVAECSCGQSFTV